MVNSYGYQGDYAEFDKRTGWNRFALRGNYDARLGRWMSADPYNQFASPYVGMGNIPNLGTDPDGGLFWPIFSQELLEYLALGPEAFVLPGFIFVAPIYAAALTSAEKYAWGVWSGLKVLGSKIPQALENTGGFANGANHALTYGMVRLNNPNSYTNPTQYKFMQESGAISSTFAGILNGGNSFLPGAKPALITPSGNIPSAKFITQPTLKTTDVYGRVNAGESSATKNGRLKHKEYNPGENYSVDPKVNRLPSGKIPDAIDFRNKIVREYKPNNLRALKRGIKQVREYRDELKGIHGGNWKWNVDTY